ncbi:radical SAM protein [Magnetovirga frankeli]|uniref:radical SAM/SPASM domain-containing protein n=1 Tax=Magnetovirga frankeli TaxID=947516 RepID=UPI001AF270C9|nr:radical SAM protein [gamma proteobacterium SS-5]
MQAKIKPGYDNQRRLLRDIVPLDTPFTLFIAPSQVCNFKCSYCLHALSNSEKKAKGFSLSKMKFSVFKKIVYQSKKFPRKFKRVLLTGLGEPMANPRIADMVKLISENDISEKIEIFTNGYYLNEKISSELIKSGLTKLRLSIQGINDEQYKLNTGVKIDFLSLVEKISNFFIQSRGKCEVYIKVIEEELRDKTDHDRFYDIFGSICDEIFIENLTQAQPMLGNYNNKISNDKTFYGELSAKRNVCPFIFYSLQIDINGNCFPCPPLSLPLEFSLGNINDEDITLIWNGTNHKNLMLSHLMENREKPDICKFCTNYLCFTPKEDNLDEIDNNLIKKIEGL